LAGRAAIHPASGGSTVIGADGVLAAVFFAAGFGVALDFAFAAVFFLAAVLPAVAALGFAAALVFVAVFAVRVAIVALPVRTQRAVWPRVSRA
jgi:hypothetical protein